MLQLNILLMPTQHMLKSFKGFEACLPGTSDGTSDGTSEDTQRQRIANCFDSQQVARSVPEPLLSQFDTLLSGLPSDLTPFLKTL